jgi:hypothetical protein
VILGVSTSMREGDGLRLAGRFPFPPSPASSRLLRLLTGEGEREMLLRLRTIGLLRRPYLGGDRDRLEATEGERDSLRR